MIDDPVPSREGTRTYGAAGVNFQLREAGAPGLVAVFLDVDGGPVGEGGSGARYATSTDQRRWVIKSHVFGGQPHRYLCLNEAVCAQIAMWVGIDVPQPAVMELTTDQLEAMAPTASATDRFVYASARIDPSEPLSGTAADDAYGEQLAGIAVLDALVANTDQKPEHLRAQKRDDGSWRVVPVDYGHTLATADALSGFDAAKAPSPPHSLLQPRLTRDAADQWIKRFEKLRPAQISAMVEGLPPAWSWNRMRARY